MIDGQHVQRPINVKVVFIWDGWCVVDV